MLARINTRMNNKLTFFAKPSKGFFPHLAAQPIRHMSTLMNKEMHHFLATPLDQLKLNAGALQEYAKLHDALANVNNWRNEAITTGNEINQQQYFGFASWHFYNTNYYLVSLFEEAVKDKSRFRRNDIRVSLNQIDDLQKKFHISAPPDIQDYHSLYQSFACYYHRFQGMSPTISQDDIAIFNSSALHHLSQIIYHLVKRQSAIQKFDLKSTDLANLQEIGKNDAHIDAHMASALAELDLPKFNNKSYTFAELGQIRAALGIHRYQPAVKMWKPGSTPVLTENNNVIENEPSRTCRLM